MRFYLGNVAIVAMLSVASSARAQSSWAQPVDGFWQSAFNWQPQFIPFNGTATLGFTTPYTVTLTGGVTMAAVNISNPQATLAIANNNSLAVGSLTSPMNGTIMINDSFGGNGTYLLFNSFHDAIIPGPGTYWLRAAGNGLDRAYIQVVGGGRAINQALIRGTGNLYGQWVNNGTLQADTSGGIMQFANNITHTNTNIIQAVNGGIFSINNFTLDQSGGGRLIANNGVVSLNNSTIVGGTVEALAGGAVAINGSVTWSGVSPIGPQAVPNNCGLYIVTPGLIHNDTMTINPSGGGNGTIMRFSAGGTYGGSGTTILNATDNGLDRAYIQSINLPVTQGANHTIRGSGNIYGAWINDGLVQADVTGGILQFNGNSANFNNNLVKATSGGILSVNGGVFDQSGGGRLVADTGSINFSNATLVGGTLESRNGSTVSVTSAAIDGSTIEILSSSTITFFGSSTWNNAQAIGPIMIANNSGVYVASVGLTHDDVITINPTGGGNGTFLQFNSGGTYDGSGTLVLNATDNGLDRAYVVANGQPITHGANHTIRGTGNMYGQWINNGTIQADVSGGILQFATSTGHVNNKLIQAVNGGVVTINSSSVEQGPSGRLVANGGTLNLNSTYVIGGTVESLNNGPVVLTGTVTWNQVQPVGPVMIPNNNTLAIWSSGLSHNDTITINPSGGGNGTALLFYSGGVFGGTGTTVLNATDNGFDRAYVNAVNQPLTHGSGRTLRGSGNLYGQWINNGLIKADLPGRGIQFATNIGQFNNNLIEAVNGGYFNVNSLTLNQSGGGRLVADGGAVNLNSCYILGGTVEALNAGSVGISGNVSFNSVHPIGPLAIPNNNSLSIVSSGLSHDNVLTINPSGGGNGTALFMNAGGTIGGTGKVVLNSTSGGLDRAYIRVNGPTVTLASTKTIEGSGNLYGLWNIAGTLAPAAATGDAPGSGRLNFEFTPTLLSTTQFKIGVGPQNRNDRVTANGTLLLDGKLQVSLLGGFNPPTGSTYDIIIASSIFGTLDTSALSTKFTVSYLADRVRLTATCAADLNDDGLVDDADFVIFIAAYNILDCTDPAMPQGCPADLNGDGVVEDADFVLFASAYNELVCPS